MENLNKKNIITNEIYHLIEKHIENNDYLENPNFDSIAYLNEIFPDFESLNKLPEFVDQWEKELISVDEQLDILMTERAQYSDDMKLHIYNLNNDVSEIILFINSIKKNADINENTVKAICNDIKNLDNARNNVTNTISSLTKLIMLINGIESLEISVKNKDYKEASNQIGACNDILLYFSEYKHISQINSLQNKKNNLCISLNASIQQEFKNNLKYLPQNENNLSFACICANSIGDSSVNSLKIWFINFKLIPYDELFNPKNNIDPIDIEDTERRFEWLKRVLKEYNEKYDSVFPLSWGFKSYLCQEFCRITKIHLNNMLNLRFNNTEKDLKLDVDLLVKILNSTILFEQQMQTYLKNDYENTKNAISNKDKLNIKKNLYDISNKSTFLALNTSEEMKIKYCKNKDDKDISEYLRKRQDPNNQPKFDLFKVKGIISECFEPYMISYVNIEEKKLVELINSLKKNDKIEGKLWISSLHLFKNIQLAMNRCLSFSKSRTFYDLVLCFNNIFKIYNDKVILPKIMPIYNNFNFYLSSLENLIDSNQNRTTSKDIILNNNKICEEEIKNVYYMLSTCDYCNNTISALNVSIKEKIDDKYKYEYSFESSESIIRKSYNYCFEIIFYNLKLSILDNFYYIIKKNSINIDDESSCIYIENIKKAVDITLDNAKDIINEEYIIHIINNLPEIICNIFLNLLYKIKHIDESGASKLLVDVFEIKSYLFTKYKNISLKPIEGDINYQS